MIPIGEPVLRLEVITDKDNNGYLDPFNSKASLKCNHTYTMIVGTAAMCLSARETILEGRGFTVPEDWEPVWSFRKQPCWTPLKDTVSTGDLVFWYDNAGIVQDSGSLDKVSQWDDRGPNALTLSCATAERPTFLQSTASSWIDKKAAIFPDTATLEYLYTSSNLTQFDGAKDAIGFIVVDNIIGTVGTNVVLSLPGNNASSFYVEFANSIFSFGWGATTNKAASPTIADTGRHVVVFHKKGTVLSILLDGSIGSTGTGVNKTFNNVFGLGNQGSATPGAPAGMSILEAGAWSFASDASRDFSTMAAIIEGYVAHKYTIQGKLPESHSFKSTYPSYSETYSTIGA